jgi:uncharacterized protein
MSTRISPATIIGKHYSEYPKAHRILLDHSRKVTRKALKIGHHLISQGHTVDLQFLAEASMLHDIGMILTNTPDLDCHGDGPYLQHGLRGKKLLEREGLPQHARVCERHIGVGLTAEEIQQQQLPLPEQDMRPQTLEEQIICYADLFFSKSKNNRDIERSPDAIRKKLKQYGENKVKIFDQWLEKFEPELS